MPHVDKHLPIVVSDQTLTSLLSGGKDTGALQRYELFLLRRGAPLRKVPLANEYVNVDSGLTLSPDGKHATIALLAENRPETWKEYRFPTWLRWIVRFDLIEVATGHVEHLLDAPSSAWRPELAWNADSSSVVLGSTYLPLDGTAQRLGVPTTKEVSAEVRLSDRRVSLVASEATHVIQWASDANLLVLEDGQGGARAFSKHDAAWRQDGGWMDPHEAAQPFRIERERGMHQPDRLVAVDKSTGAKRVILDPNPQFKELRFGEVREISWQTPGGQDVRCGLYLPLGYVEGRRYPLVIQTHGWSKSRFWIDGPSTAGYAAQALAGKGFVVAQVEGASDDSRWASTPKEGPVQMGMLESLIDTLDQQGMIEPDRVGLLGWSRSGYLTRYTLVNSKYSFGAAVIVDGYDDGYFHYLSRLNLGKAEVGEYEHMIGAVPSGAGLSTWMQRSTGFNLERVHTPLRLLGLSPTSLLTNWEWFAGLTYLSKPVEFTWIPKAGHAPNLPSDRLTSQEGDVDWFAFWLKGEEDPNPAKREQYARWRALRSLAGSKMADNVLH